MYVLKKGIKKDPIRRWTRRKMLGPDQYLHDPVPRARRFIQRVDHRRVVADVLRARSA